MNQNYLLTSLIVGSICTLAYPAQGQTVTTEPPLPGTVATNTAAFFSIEEKETKAENQPSEVAQRDIRLGRITTRHDYGYIALGANFGFTSNPIESSLGESASFAINGKIAFNNNFSLRPGVIISSDQTAWLIPLTYDFTIKSQPFEAYPIVPFVGGGLIVSSRGDNDVGFLLSAGSDFRLAKRVVLNANVNAGFFDRITDVGIIVSLGYILTGY